MMLVVACESTVMFIVRSVINDFNLALFSMDDNMTSFGSGAFVHPNTNAIRTRINMYLEIIGVYILQLIYYNYGTDGVQ